MTPQAEKALKVTGTPMTPDKLFLAMLAVLSCSSGVRVEYLYWAYLPNPPLLSIVDWVNKAPMVFTNDSLPSQLHGQNKDQFMKKMKEEK